MDLEIADLLTVTVTVIVTVTVTATVKGGVSTSAISLVAKNEVEVNQIIVLGTLQGWVLGQPLLLLPSASQTGTQRRAKPKIVAVAQGPEGTLSALSLHPKNRMMLEMLLTEIRRSPKLVWPALPLLGL